MTNRDLEAFRSRLEDNIAKARRIAKAKKAVFVEIPRLSRDTACEHNRALMMQRLEDKVTALLEAEQKRLLKEW